MLDLKTRPSGTLLVLPKSLRRMSEGGPGPICAGLHFKIGSGMINHNSKDPLHGVTLEMILQRLVEHYGWEKLGSSVKIRCFNFDPSIKSSLTFLRKTLWARKKVEELYIRLILDK